MLSLCCVFVGASHFMVFSQNVNFTPRCALYIQSITTHICTYTKSLVEQLASGNYSSHIALKRETRILFISWFFVFFFVCFFSSLCLCRSSACPGVRSRRRGTALLVTLLLVCWTISLYLIGLKNGVFVQQLGRFTLQ